VTTKRKKVKKGKAPAAHERKRRRMPISAVKVKSLGYQCESLTEADTKIDLDKPLAKIIEKYKSLKAAWRRGKLLRELEGLAETATVSQAAFKLKELGFEEFATGQVLRNFMDHDSEADDLWRSVSITTWINNRRNLLTAAADGNARAMQLVEIWLKDRTEDSPIGSDTGRLRVNEIAEIFGVTRITINDWYKKQGLPRNGDGSFDLKTAIRWFEDFTIKKCGRGKGPVSILNPFQQVKTERERVKLLRDQGAVVNRGNAIGWQVAQLQNILNEFHKIPDYANLMFQQPREEIARVLEDLRDQITAKLQHIPEELKLSNEAKEILMALYRVLI